MLHPEPVENQFTKRVQDRLKKHLFIDVNYQRKLETSEIAGLARLTREAFCRYFKKMTRLTFTEFVNHYRLDKAKMSKVPDRVHKTDFYKLKTTKKQTV